MFLSKPEMTLSISPKTAIAGNINVTARLGSLTVVGGGEVPHFATDRHMRSQAMVGHGGHRTGFLGYFGDITVNTARDITITGGAYGDTFAKIGHKGSDDFGQVGGNYNRGENFLFDGISTNITSVVNGNTARVTYGDGATWDGGAIPIKPATEGNFGTFGTQNLSGGFNANGTGSSFREFTLTSNTANISVNSSSGTVKLNHLDAQKTLAAIPTATSMEDSYSQIGHGGQNLAGQYWLNSRTNYDDMVGNVTVSAMGSTGDLILEGGNREGMWSRVGHGFTGNGVRISGNEAMLIGGAITVNVGRDVFLNGAKGAETDVNFDQPARDNGLAIGHGFMAEASSRGNLAVLDGQRINGLTPSSTISVNAGQDVKIQGGNGAHNSLAQFGASGTHSQIGHGGSSFDGNSLSGLGFNGDVNVIAGRDINLRATDNGTVILNASLATPPLFPSAGGAAIIGNGGIHMDAPATGDIYVYAGNNLGITASQRHNPNTTPGEDPNFSGQRGDPGFTHLNFAKIGHFSSENQLSGVVNVGSMMGDISVIVGNNFTMKGGRTADHSTSNFLDTPLNNGRTGVTYAFSQVGHGGPGIDGNMLGDIEIKVGNNFNTFDGTIDASGLDSVNFPTPISANNYVKIGHGDWLRDGSVGTKRNNVPIGGSTFATAGSGARGSSTGFMFGDIVVEVGDSANLENTLIGHIDPALGAAFSLPGEIHVAVSRNFPFYDETGARTGTLTATGIRTGELLDPVLPAVDPVTGLPLSQMVRNQTDAVGVNLGGPAYLGGTNVVSGTVFASGSQGADPISLYMPERAANLMAIGSTRLNSRNTFYNGYFDGILGVRPFGLPNGTGPLAGPAIQSDEVFLAPDLWWMDDADVADATAVGWTTTGRFPTSNDSQGGVVATVGTPGGLPNLEALTIGALGSSPNGSAYRTGSPYTLFYDAIEAVSTDIAQGPPPPPPTPPSLDLLKPFVFADLFDSFQRQADGFDGYLGGAGFVGDLPYRNQLADDMGVPNWFLEEMLDMGMGPRRSGGSSATGTPQASNSPGEEGSIVGSSSDVAREDDEEIKRRNERNNRVGPVGTVYYIYTPGSVNPYSSINLFGQPE